MDITWILCTCTILSVLVTRGSSSIVETRLKRDSEQCAVKFRRYQANHTACLPTSKNKSPSRSNGVSEYNKDYIVRMHNYYRSNVHKYNKQPQAANMQKMYWDDELAMLAQKWASNCMWEHDTAAYRNVPGSYPVGQNLGKGHRGWGAVLRHWQMEVAHLKFGEGKEKHKPIGHYTQLVWAESARVGCGYARCNKTASFYVCNYAPTGNYVSEQYTPYKPGPTASSCANTKTGGLCDCGGKVCKNGGELNLNTCQCKCLSKQWIDQDSNGDCSLRCSKASDIFMCASRGGSWDINHCERYANVPHEYCPISCRLCPADTSEDVTTPSYGINQVDNSNDHTEPFPMSTEAIAYDYKSKDGIWKSVLNSNSDRKTDVPDVTLPFTTAPVNNQPTTFTTKLTTTPTTPAQITLDASVVGLPLCPEPVEPAKCGQPSSRGYYNPVYCNFGLDYYCPAMCGKCRVSSCVDYDLNNYQIGETWMNQFGKLTCTASGVKVQRGCFIEKLDVVIDEDEEYQYIDGNISWSCTCATGYALSCKGVWSPSGRTRY